MQTYRGLILNPKKGDFEIIEDGIVGVEKGIVQFISDVKDISEFTIELKEKIGELGICMECSDVFYDRSKIRETEDAILPYGVNTHDHVFQPPSIPGSLINQKNDGSFYGWLPTTLIEGEQKAKDSETLARKWAKSRLLEFVENGIGQVLEYTTSSKKSAEIVLEEAEKIGINVMVGFVAMDQEIDFIDKNLSLEESTEKILEETEYLLKKHGANKICVIDRFPIAVSSKTRELLALLARKYGALYETHMDESLGEKEIHSGIYKERGFGKSIVKILEEDGVFEKGSRVGLAHAIHTTDEEMALLKNKIENGCEIFIRACPNSNGHLGSHFSENDEYTVFPLEKWKNIGAIISLGTDQGAGKNNNIFQESLDAKIRQPKGIEPLELLKMATINGSFSLGIKEIDLQIKEGAPANFSVIEMKGAKSFYENSKNQDISRQIMRVIEGGINPKNIKTLYVEGRKLKG